MQATDRIAELIVTMQEFSALLDTETAAVKAASSATVSALLDRKQFLALHYRRQMACLADHTTELQKLDSKVKAQFQLNWQAFNRSMAANTMALEVAQKASSQVVDLIVDAMRRGHATMTETTYGRSYRKSAEAHATAIGNCAITYNRVL